jgi:hypothetical protein
LDKWYIDLPEHLRHESGPSKLPVPPPHILTLHMQYWCTVLLLHRPLYVSQIDVRICFLMFLFSAFVIRQVLKVNRKLPVPTNAHVVLTPPPMLVFSAPIIPMMEKRAYSSGKAMKCVLAPPTTSRQSVRVDLNFYDAIF